MFQNFIQKIVEWFHDRQSRTQLIIGFNRDARESFVDGIAPVLLEACISKGCREYRHQFSNYLYSGFRIKAYAGRQLTREETIALGNAILADDKLVRRMVVLGWDTLEIHSDSGNYGCRWQLKDYIMLQ
ncbi:MAG: hypothetical protein MJZ45_02810 [Bacteroidales bacterium]|nr:hypothetical protein [Bacteroidales bacterium]